MEGQVCILQVFFCLTSKGSLLLGENQLYDLVLLSYHSFLLPKFEPVANCMGNGSITLTTEDQRSTPSLHSFLEMFL